MAVDVGLNIKNRRKRLRLSQARLSDLSGISQSAISDIENPDVTKRPNTDTIQKIASALQCTVAELMGEQPPVESDVSFEGLTPDEVKLIQDYRNLNHQGQEYIRQTMYMALPIYKRHSDLPDMADEKISG